MKIIVNTYLELHQTGSASLNSNLFCLQVINISAVQDNVEFFGGISALEIDRDMIFRVGTNVFSRDYCVISERKWR